MLLIDYISQHLGNSAEIEPLLSPSVFPLYFSNVQAYIYCYYYGVVSHKAPQALQTFLIHEVLHLSSYHSWFIHQSSLANTYQQRHLSREKLDEKANFADAIFIIILRSDL
jgi:hypothetical protein